MKTNALLFSALLLLFASACTKREKPATEDVYEPVANSTVAAQRDTVLFGVLGEETAMSSLQLITDEGDTLSILKINEETGEEGTMEGEINYVDRVRICAKVMASDEMYLVSFQNLTSEGQTEN